MDGISFLCNPIKTMNAMKRVFPLLSIYFLMTVLCGCNSDVFIDDFAPSTDQMQVPADGSAATLRFDGDNWYVRGLFWEKKDMYEEVRGDIYDADGTQLYFNVPFHFSDLGLAKYVASYPQFTLTLERTGGKELQISDAENIGLEACRLSLGVGNNYEYRAVELVLEPSPRYRLDSIVYSLDAWYYERDSAMTQTFQKRSSNYTDTPVEMLISPYAAFTQTFTFAGGDLWSPIDPSLFQMFGTEMPVVPVPRLDKYNNPALLGDELPLSGESHEFPLSDELLSVTDTVVVPPGKAVECVVKCWFRYTGIPYEIYASCPQTGRRRVLEGRADLYTPQGYSLATTVRDVNIQQ